MIDHETNLAIIKYLGARQDIANVGPKHERVDVVWFRGKCRLITNLPNYCNDLNLMHEIEMQMDEATYAKYLGYLQVAVGKDFAARAPAKTRADALLSLIWETK